MRHPLGGNFSLYVEQAPARNAQTELLAQQTMGEAAIIANMSRQRYQFPLVRCFTRLLDILQIAAKKIRRDPAQRGSERTPRQRETVLEKFFLEGVLGTPKVLTKNSLERP